MNRSSKIHSWRKINNFIFITRNRLIATVVLSHHASITTRYFPIALNPNGLIILSPILAMLDRSSID